MALPDETFEFRGLVFGEGQTIMVNHAEGFEGFDVRSSDSDQPRGDGGIRGLDYVAPRTIAFELVAAELEDIDGTVYEAKWQQIRSTFRPSRDEDFDLKFKRPGQPERIIRCRPIQLTRREDYRGYNRIGFPPVVLRAVDPRIYSSTIRSGNVPTYSATGGGVDFDLNFASEFNTIGGTQIEYVAQNDGNTEAYPKIRFYGSSTGSIDSVTLTNTTTDQAITVATHIGSGQILTADMPAAVTAANRLVISLDGASRYGDWELPRTAFALAPGSNTLRYEINGTATDSVCNMQWHDTWID